MALPSEKNSLQDPSCIFEIPVEQRDPHMILKFASMILQLRFPLKPFSFLPIPHFGAR
jgi:hypothetical protein